MGRCRCCLLVAASLLTTAAAAAFGWFYVWQVLYAPYLQGARDIVYDAARERVIISALHSNVIAVVDVATPSKPRTLGWRADDAFTNTHGFAYDHGSATAYVASYGRGSLAKVDLRNPARDKLPVVATLKNDELYSATHASYDAARNLVFVTAAGSHGLAEDADVLRGGHDLLGVDAATMRRTGLLTEWGAGAEPAYPVYCVYDAARALLVARAVDGGLDRQHRAVVRRRVGLADGPLDRPVAEFAREGAGPGAVGQVRPRELERLRACDAEEESRTENARAARRSRAREVGHVEDAVGLDDHDVGRVDDEPRVALVRRLGRHGGLGLLGLLFRRFDHLLLDPRDLVLDLQTSFHEQQFACLFLAHRSDLGEAVSQDLGVGADFIEGRLLLVGEILQSALLLFDLFLAPGELFELLIEKLLPLE